MPVGFSQSLALPPGLAFNTPNGMISGTPTALGAFTGRIIAFNFTLPNDDKFFNITITAQPPSAPTIITAVAGDAQASITFTPSINAGSGPILNYTATCNPGAHAASGLTSPIDVTGLANGTTYTCGVTVTTQYGSADSGTLLVTPILNAPPALVTVKSRKIHGTAGAQFLPIDINATINGAVTVEPRGGGSAGHTLVFIFNRAITDAGTVTAKDASGANVGNVTNVAAGNTVEVTLRNAPDNKRVAVSLVGVNASTTNFAASLGFLVGDVNNNRTVNASDISGVKAHLNQTVTEANFRFDLNASGSIDAADISAVKSRAGVALP